MGVHLVPKTIEVRKCFHCPSAKALASSTTSFQMHLDNSSHRPISKWGVFALSQHNISNLKVQNSSFSLCYEVVKQSSTCLASTAKSPGECDGATAIVRASWLEYRAPQTLGTVANDLPNRRSTRNNACRSSQNMICLKLRFGEQFTQRTHSIVNALERVSRP